MIPVAYIIQNVRRVLHDTSSNNPRWSDEDLRAALGLAVADVRRMRPDAFYPATDQMPDVFNVESLELDAFFLSPLTYLTSGHALASQDQMAKAGVSESHLAMGRAALVSIA